MGNVFSAWKLPRVDFIVIPQIHMWDTYMFVYLFVYMYVCIYQFSDIYNGTFKISCYRTQKSRPSYVPGDEVFRSGQESHLWCVGLYSSPLLLPPTPLPYTTLFCFHARNIPNSTHEKKTWCFLFEFVSFQLTQWFSNPNIFLQTT